MANYFKKRKDSKKRETMIVFVYDTEYCQEESDDPVQAVLYFHPSWVSDTQKLSLCGQLMGTTYFFKNCFFKPKIIALQNGKFILKEFGRFILAIGTDRNLSDSLLEHRAELLTSLLKFFHRDIQTIYDQFMSSSSLASTTKTSASFCGQYKNLSDKLYHIFETYLPILQYNGNIFQNISKLRLPKSASNIFLDAIQTLQSCQQIKGVLGGTILYHNKVVATQLSPEITKNLVLTDPFHIKSSAEPIYVDFYVPIGVQMLIVYISQNDYHKLQYDSQKAQNIVTQNFSNILNGGTITTTSTTTLPSYQFQIKRKIKRDKSLIFTNIPEESHNESNVATTTNSIDSIDNNSKEILKNVTTENFINNKPITKKTTRPNHLPLKFKNVTSKEIPESGFVSINFDETDSYSEFIGKTSVCSTPMTENKILQYDNILSICSNPTEQNLLLQNDKTIKSKSNFFRKQSIEENNEENNQNDNDDDSKTPKSIKKFNNFLSKIDFDKFFTNFFISNPYKKYERRNSLTDLHDSIRKFSKRLTTTTIMKSTTSLTSPSPTENLKNNNNINNECITSNIDGDLSNSDLIDDVIDNTITKRTTVTMDIDGKKKKKRKFFGTITDPMYPVFNSDGEPISKSLFQEFLHKYYNKTNSNSETEINIKTEDNDNGIAKNTVEDDQNTTKVIEEYKEFDSELNKLNEKFINNDKEEENPTNENKNEEKEIVKQIPNRKSLSLPLKPLNDPSSSSAMIEKDNQTQCVGNGIFERKKHSGIQLTPLMAKLSILALNNDERSSGFCSWDTTPGLELSTPIDTTNKNLRRRSSIRNDDLLDSSTTTTITKQFKKVELYICGQQNMTLLLLMEEGAGQKQNLVQSLFDTCVSKLTRIESQLNQTLNVNVDGDKSEGGYSYICIDPKWDTLQRGGPWSITDMDSLEHMHKDLNLQHSITDLILRTDDSVLYGYKCGSSEFFYKQSAQGQNNGGIPPPADIMGTISMRAKRRLERDHSLILF